MNKLTLHLADAEMDSARKFAAERHVSVEDYASELLSSALKEDAIWARYVEVGRKVTREEFLAILAKAPDVEPDPPDRID